MASIGRCTHGARFAIPAGKSGPGISNVHGIVSAPLSNPGTIMTKAKGVVPSAYSMCWMRYVQRELYPENRRNQKKCNFV